MQQIFAALISNAAICICIYFSSRKFSTQWKQSTNILFISSDWLGIKLNFDNLINGSVETFYTPVSSVWNLYACVIWFKFQNTIKVSNPYWSYKQYAT